jgi:asparaginyl-tRNA synthetase
MSRIEIKHLYAAPPMGTSVTVKGWVRAFRGRRFLALNDGTTLQTLQVVLTAGRFAESLVDTISVGAAISATGILQPSIGAEQPFELLADTLEVIGVCDPSEYPIQPKKHSLEFLREKAHLRWRTNTFAAVFRIRHAASFAIHKYFHERGFFNVHTPIITASDCEGAGEMFQVTTLDIGAHSRTATGEVDFSQDFFGKQACLTVSGQLEAETAALALGKVYTFGPTFRAENSNTSRHLAEFWMIEPEVAFNDIHDNMDLAEDFLQYLIAYVLEHCTDDLRFLDARLKEEEAQKPAKDRRVLGLIESLEFVKTHAFERITYTDAIEILLQSKRYKEGKFQFPVSWGIDLQSEHERYLVEQHFKKPVIVTGYPMDIKAFYMKCNPDGKTVAAMDILFPGIGEIIGGSQREEDETKLRTRMKDMHIPQEDLWWYLELRRFGTAPHSGFGLGFERFVQFVTGMSNIRDVIPFARTPKSLEF